MEGRILIVEDERDLLRSLEYALSKEGFETRGVETGSEAVEAATAADPPDLVLLDLMLPDINGTEVCRRLRGDARTSQVPIVMLTAKGDEIDRVVGFEVGADDYVVKPYSMREIILRVRAVLRRAQVAEVEVDREELRFDGLRVDVPAHRVWVRDHEIHLTALEFRLLTTFLSRKGRVQTRERLLEDVWGMRADLTTRTVDTHVKRLREKLGEAGAYIETLRGVGYRFRSTSAESSAA